MYSSIIFIHLIVYLNILMSSVLIYDGNNLYNIGSTVYIVGGMCVYL